MQAIKMYRMALDQISRKHYKLRQKVYSNIGNAFLRIGQLKDAIKNYESALSSGSNLKTEFNLLLCFIQVGDVEKSKHLMIMIASRSSDTLSPNDDESKANIDMGSTLPDPNFDRCTIEERERKKTIDLLTFNAARLVASMKWGQTWDAGYIWVQEQLKRKHEKISLLIKMEECVAHLKRKNMDSALLILKSFDKKEKDVTTMAANNLSFIYFLEGNIDEADKLADLALSTNRYNPCALVSKGNALYVKNEPDKARDMYLEAIGVSSSCVEAIYNLGITNIKLGALDEARNAFEKLNSFTKNDPCALYQIANIHQMQGRNTEAIKWLNVLSTCTPTDPGICSQIGSLYGSVNDDSQCLHQYIESYRIYPSNLDVISWLGVWFVKHEMYEKSASFFERASLVQPKEAKWQLMVASCYRRMGDYNEALNIYKKVHEIFPENSECKYIEIIYYVT